MGMFTYRIATEAERKLPVEHLECGYLCGEYLLCVMGYDGPVEYWSAAKLSNGVLEFVEGVENCDDAMECAIRLHEVLLAAGIVGDTGTTVATNKKA